MLLKEVYYAAHQCCIYLIKTTVKTVIQLHFKVIVFYFNTLKK